MSGKDKSPSLFMQAASTLDSDFAIFEKVTREIETLEINSERGLERGQSLLAQVDECARRIGPGMVALAEQLELARARTEKAGEIIKTRATEIQERKQLADMLLERFRLLGDMVGQVTSSIAQVHQSDVSELTSEDRDTLAKSLPEVNGKLGILVEEAHKLMKDAHDANLKTLERSADSLRQKLQSSSNRFTLFIKQQTGSNAEPNLMN